MIAQCKARLTIVAVAFATFAATPGLAANPSGIYAAHFQAGHIVRPAGSAVNWPQLGFDPGHSGYNPLESTLSVTNVGQLQEAWTAATGPGNMAGNLVEYNGTIYAESQNGTLFAIDAASGATLWTFASAAPANLPGDVPAADDGMVFSVCHAPGAHGTSGNPYVGLCALNAATGAIVWRYYPVGTTYIEPPVVSGQRVFFEVCGVSSPCSDIAVSEKTGAVVWSAGEYCADSPSSNGVPAAVGGGYAIMTFNAGAVSECNEFYIAGLAPATGKLNWGLSGAYVYEGVSATSSAAIVTAFYTPGDVEEFTPFDPRTGVAPWLSNTNYSTPGTMSVGGIAYRTFYLPFETGLFSFRTTGRPLGHFIAAGGIFSGVAVANGVVYTLLNGSAAALSAGTLQTLWQTTGTSSVGFPIVVNGAVYGACNGTNICAWALPNPLR